MKKVICAIDTGYGHVKHACVGADQKPVFGSFPSFSPALAPAQSARNYRVREAIIDGARYAVGPESALLLPVNFDRIRTANFSQAPEYRALMLGALSYLGQPVIDELVIGLPLNTIGQFRSRLIAEWTGSHAAPAFDGGEGQREVLVKNVRVLPQPMGSALAHCGFDEALQSGRYLVIDVGFVTMDYMVIEDMRINAQRAGALEFGVSRFIDELLEYVRHFIKTAYSENSPIDIEHRIFEEALRGNLSIRTAWGPVDLKPGIEQANAAMVRNLRAMESKIGKLSSIEGIILSGGGAAVMEPAFRSTFPMFKTVSLSKNPQLDVVTGYLNYGMSMAEAMHV